MKKDGEFGIEEIIMRIAGTGEGLKERVPRRFKEVARKILAIEYL